MIAVAAVGLDRPSGRRVHALGDVGVVPEIDQSCQQIDLSGNSPIRNLAEQAKAPPAMVIAATS